MLKVMRVMLGDGKENASVPREETSAACVEVDSESRKISSEETLKSNCILAFSFFLQGYF